MSENGGKKLGAAFWALMLAGTGAVSLIAAVAVFHDDGGILPAFSSADELREFVDSTRPDEIVEYYDGSGVVREPAGDASMDAGEGAYSTTNIQVEGVDEADTVKTNGELIFVLAYDSVKVIDPDVDENMSVLSTIDHQAISQHLPDDSYIYLSGIYVLEDTLLITLGTYGQYPYLLYDADDTDADDGLAGPASYVAVVDVSDPTRPSVLSATGVSGWTQASRLLEGVVHLVTVHSIWWYEEEVPLPAVWADGDFVEVDPSDIRYDKDGVFADSYINVLSLDVRTGQFETVSILSSWASVVYMTKDNLYITYQKWSGETFLVEGSLSPEDTSSARTTIYRLTVDGLHLSPVAKGEVDGWLLNQFSMDERDGFLRLATTTSWRTPENAVFVLDDDLTKVGEVAGLAPSERIYSARFLGDTLYLVTFLRVDPLFVIDLGDPYSPTVLGELKVPGFSSYLHPIGDGLLLGVGSENWTAKVSVFDVSNEHQPAEVDTAFLGEGLVPDGFIVYSHSVAEWDHKAFMYDPARRMLVLPLSVTAWSYSDEGDYYTDYEFVRWDGFCVLGITEDGHLERLGMIAHPDYAKRALHIGDRLYTISESTVVCSSIPGLEHIGSLVYSYSMNTDGYETIGWSRI